MTTRWLGTAAASGYSSVPWAGSSSVSIVAHSCSFAPAIEGKMGRESITQSKRMQCGFFGQDAFIVGVPDALTAS